MWFEKRVEIEENNRKIKEAVVDYFDLIPGKYKPVFRKVAFSYRRVRYAFER
jgi:hypothetical protein